ncbi:MULTISPECIES: MarR family winged helix-turn-helix transcriptional regulator [Bacillus amyloliquefaciens group]|uniref:MarR family winged helix-turn-helix transcriptional regulator n=1 Tax=Bacillus amyloliquefaciens group TaxID=1938374 RepID=UPI0012DA7511|nr:MULTISPECIES: MarR family transcriptional regulator [Bacillus amyloliquefaciens group]MCE4939221.1 MarR family transcriptional regulator [Bacillus velezensis]MDH3084903.1 MarR family transcriptional regulator [Bacillus velezensis]MDL0429095.1 MarR family transcriptional regulator [Bacillus amyloliquefaciens]NRF36935.1 MarR family transcriptional regulator [Bacillus velezensis]WEY81285.1 MarR family transcriptional regulator [Bacillus velezensis]
MRKRKWGWVLTACCSEEGEILYQLQSLHKVIGTKFEACTGISQSRLELLAVLFYVDEISQSDLQKKVNIDGAAVTRHLKQLEAKEMVTRRRKPEDNRIILVRLTDQGRERIEASKKEKERFIKEMLAGVSAEERSMLKNVLSQMQNNIENMKA